MGPLFRVEGEVYRVADRRAHESRVACVIDGRPEWHEYVARLIRNSDGSVVAEWDSYEECYNGLQWLTREDCENALRDIAADVEAGNELDWFTIEGE